MHAAFTIHDLHHSGFNALFLLHSITARALQASRRQSPTAQSLHAAHSLHISRRQQYISLQYFSFHAGTDRYLVLDLFCCAHKQNGNHEGVPKTERARMSSNVAFNRPSAQSTQSTSGLPISNRSLPLLPSFVSKLVAE